MHRVLTTAVERPVQRHANGTPYFVLFCLYGVCGGGGRGRKG